jgi:hypothetical protein
MDNGRVGSKGSAVVSGGGAHQGSLEVAMGVARSINHVVVATEGIARAIIFVAFCLVLYYAADREPPFAVLTVEPAYAQPGQSITIKAAVRRDVERGCNAEFSRYVFDSGGAGFDLGHAISSAEMISRMERDFPGALMVKFQVPADAQPGPALLQTVLDYRCNRTHNLWPIQVTTAMPFTVLPLP